MLLSHQVEWHRNDKAERWRHLTCLQRHLYPRCLHCQTACASCQKHLLVFLLQLLHRRKCSHHPPASPLLTSLSQPSRLPRLLLWARCPRTRSRSTLARLLTMTPRAHPLRTMDLPCPCSALPPRRRRRSSGRTRERAGSWGLRMGRMGTRTTTAGSPSPSQSLR